MKDWRIPIRHMLDCIDAILEYSKESRSAFLADRKTVDAVVRNFEILGEAAKRVPEDIRNQALTVPWRRIAGFRDVLIHQYEVVDPIEIWSVIERDIPGLREALRALINSPSDN